MSSAMQTTYSTKHEHEPEIPPTFDDEGRCLVCVVLVERDRLERRLRVAEPLADAAKTLDRVYAESGTGSEFWKAYGVLSDAVDAAEKGEPPDVPPDQGSEIGPEEPPRPPDDDD